MIRTVPRSIFPHTLGLICLLLHDMPVNFPSLGRVEIGCKIKHKMHAMQFFFSPLSLCLYKQHLFSWKPMVRPAVV